MQCKLHENAAFTNTVTALLLCLMNYYTEIKPHGKNVTQLGVSLEEKMYVLVTPYTNLINGVYHVNLGLLQELIPS